MEQNLEVISERENSPQVNFNMKARNVSHSDRSVSFKMMPQM